MKKVISSIFVTLYVLISVFVTTCLLSYNDYNITVLDEHSLIINGRDVSLNDYKKNDLIVLKKEVDNISFNDKILYYDTYANEVNVKEELVTKVEKVTNTEYTYTLSNGNMLSSEFLIGSLNSAKVFHILGGMLKLLESRFGYLFLIVLPMLVLFVYEIYSFVKEMKKDKKSGIKNEKTVKEE